jgi:hypothetical protein
MRAGDLGTGWTADPSDHGLGDVYGWAARNDGLITMAAWLGSGRTRRQRDVEVRRGRLEPVRPGVVRVAGSPHSWRQSVRAAVLSAGDGVAASHTTALALFGLGPGSASAVHLSAERSRRIHLPGVTAHRFTTLEPGDVVRLDGLAVSSPLRTIIDLSGAVDAATLGRWVDGLLRTGRMSIDALRSRSNRISPAPGRSPMTLRRVLAARVVGYDPGESELEGRIRRIIDRCGLPAPVQQFEVRLPSGRYRIDFAWPIERVFLEGNGFGFHSMASDLDRDARRQNDLVADGWRPIEITWRMSDVEIETTIRSILRLP